MTERPGRHTILRGAAALLATVLACLCSHGAAQAGDDPSAYKGWFVSSLDIRGVDPALVGGLEKGLALTPRRQLLKTRRPTFYPTILQEDLERARLYLARHGYPQARVTASFEPEVKKSRVRVILEAQAGPRILIHDIVVTGVPAALERAATASLGLTKGSPFSDAPVQQAARSIELALQRAGYASVKVESLITPLDTTRVDLQFNVQPGPKSFFGDILIDGAREDLKALVGKSIDIQPGEIYSPTRLHMAEENLRLLELFRRVRVAAAPSTSDRLNVQADLVERDMIYAEAGIGFWTDDYLRGYSRWGHRNLFKKGRGAELRGAASRFKQSVGASTWWPALLGSQTRGILNASLNREREESYNLLGVQGEFAIRYRFSAMTAARLGVAVSRINVEAKIPDEDPSVEGAGLLSIISLGWNREAIDTRFYPTRGTISGINIEWGLPGAVSENHYILGLASASSYVSLLSGVVLATKIVWGLGAPTSGSKVLLPNKRFYAGGATSMRGFKRRQLGPVDESGTPLGGEEKIEAAAEIRFPLIWRFKGALFVDSGQVWQRRQEASLDDLEIAVGPAIMVQTPVGPIRLDIGRRLTDKVPMQPKTVIHISIGNPF
ncbi:MAG: BamA/TamA family outer membrane protein [Candidatus Eisenbacteria bacterium]|uniref:BamA/TamA family outer membrane protein n=1 Tax=Eiseniibacteriota bacterium TaxID=2212470 RepID=A0A948RUM4_UNCEI|nr:BamA/TamA family outer membrane protein [Candidatus Eisenbacteria bacterium]MBU2691185.1 BamA/TamA family outer membrane protein [Candidatus Eisenbacteria bacterium]